MEQKTFLCTCINCLKENPNGVLLNQNTYNRHRKKQQTREDSLIKQFHSGGNYQEEMLSIDDTRQDDIYQREELPIDDTRQDDIYQREELPIDDTRQDDIYQEEELPIDDIHQNDIYQEEELPIKELDKNSDIESFDEDNKYYSDYSDDDDGDDDDDDDENDEEDDNDGEDDNEEDEEGDDDDAMQIDDRPESPSKKIIEGLKLLYLKSLYNFTESAYDDIIKIFTTENVSLYKVKTHLKNITGLVPIFYDMCENSCICYTEDYESNQVCPYCSSTRFDAKGKAKKVMPYLSIKDRLKIQFKDKNRAKELLYRHEYIMNKEQNDDDDFDDIFDGSIYKELMEENLFIDKRDIAFTASCDGYQIFRQKTDDCWLFLMINNNLDPSLRVKKENLLIPFLIPGPNQPKDFNTFLRPFIDEMKELESK
jgi:hypothetical protein